MLCYIAPLFKVVMSASTVQSIVIEMLKRKLLNKKRKLLLEDSSSPISSTVKLVADVSILNESSLKSFAVFLMFNTCGFALSPYFTIKKSK